MQLTPDQCFGGTRGCDAQMGDVLCHIPSASSPQNTEQHDAMGRFKHNGMKTAVLAQSGASQIKNNVLFPCHLSHKQEPVVTASLGLCFIFPKESQRHGGVSEAASVKVWEGIGC